jgi:hypothetical protein
MIDVVDGATVGCALGGAGACANGAAIVIAGIRNANTKGLIFDILTKGWVYYVGTSDWDFSEFASQELRLLTVVLNRFKGLRNIY